MEINMRTLRDLELDVELDSDPMGDPESLSNQTLEDPD
jgi:hypothetical protein